MTKDPSEKIINFCVYCGTRVEENQVYCPKCGKLVFKAEANKAEPYSKPTHPEIRPQEKGQFSRKCSGCGSIILSDVLEQCPICNALLEKVPERLKAAQTQKGFVFSEKKLRPEVSLTIKKDMWTWNEGKRIFLSSIMIYLLVYSLLITMLLYQSSLKESFTVEFSILTIMLSQIPAITYAIYPLWYIFTNDHDVKKLGFYTEYKKIIIAIIIGVVGGIALFLINFLFGYLLDTFSNSPLNLIDYESYVQEENYLIKNTELIWLVVLFLLLIVQAVSIEIAFRGVLQNALKQKFEKSSYRQVSAIIIVALAYSTINILISPLGVLFFVINFVVFVFLGILYEINGNIYNSIIASVFYQILVISYIFIG